MSLAGMTTIVSNFCPAFDHGPSQVFPCPREGGQRIIHNTTSHETIPRLQFCPTQSKGPRGLVNHKNSCFLNSAIQCLASLPPLADLCSSRSHSNLCELLSVGPKKCAFCILENQINLCLASGKAVLPREVIKLVPNLIRGYQYGSEEDAHEFLRKLLDACEQRCVTMHNQVHKLMRSPASRCSGWDSVNITKAFRVLADGREVTVGEARCDRGSHHSRQSLQDGCEDSRLNPEPTPLAPSGVEGPWNIIRELFAGVNVNRTTCLECNRNSDKKAIDYGLSLDVVKLQSVEGTSDMKSVELKSVEESLKEYFAKEMMDGENQYKCERCDKLCDGQRGCFIEKAPNALVLHLKRFEWDWVSQTTEKKNHKVQFDETLSLADWLPPGTNHPGYYLCALVCHQELIFPRGHYYAYVKDAENKWWECNDEKVTPVPTEVVFKDQAFMLFYNKAVPSASSVPESRQFQTQTQTPTQKRSSSNAFGTSADRDLLSGGSKRAQPSDFHQKRSALGALNTTPTPPLKVARNGVAWRGPVDSSGGGRVGGKASNGIGGWGGDSPQNGWAASDTRAAGEGEMPGVKRKRSSPTAIADANGNRAPANGSGRNSASTNGVASEGATWAGQGGPRSHAYKPLENGCAVGLRVPIAVGGRRGYENGTRTPPSGEWSPPSDETRSSDEERRMSSRKKGGGGGRSPPPKGEGEQTGIKINLAAGQASHSQVVGTEREGGKQPQSRSHKRSMAKAAVQGATGAGQEGAKGDESGLAGKPSSLTRVEAARGTHSILVEPVAESEAKKPKVVGGKVQVVFDAEQLKVIEEMVSQPEREEDSMEVDWWQLGDKEEEEEKMKKKKEKKEKSKETEVEKERAQGKERVTAGGSLGREGGVDPAGIWNPIPPVAPLTPPLSHVSAPLQSTCLKPPVSAISGALPATREAGTGAVGLEKEEAVPGCGLQLGPVLPAMHGIDLLADMGLDEGEWATKVIPDEPERGEEIPGVTMIEDVGGRTEVGGLKRGREESLGGIVEEEEGGQKKITKFDWENLEGPSTVFVDFWTRFISFVKRKLREDSWSQTLEDRMEIALEPLRPIRDSSIALVKEILLKSEAELVSTTSIPEEMKQLLQKKLGNFFYS